ncbi:hypothetical protein TBLA_0A02870 [Henningerozyma blattae CBS 6284]|uniref:RNB domain-containing protein n=1 Tax=Henningerozyma blattae (strain ATCC 34711 / CBS 6284 / DSM 70876 / NBRC 10599 / NRRL Y-10934 / UCD 77-7) TaxID=1071380 RepID=I2GVD4_HENB6|nr:hypothetical protein TBLA_0A02870 [Tetrapisispora blattae CBS 6284]CCH58086.1 hypothetical protein TBLA_0A02870 [Tetrapisispora blattae CBS 6284]
MSYNNTSNTNTPNINNKKQNQLQSQNQTFVPANNNGKNGPKQIHVAHRRTQSELTNLMIEQFTLQRQLEIVQAQQQQLLAQQQHLAQQTNQYLNINTNSNNNNTNNNTSINNNTNNNSRAHSRNNSGYYDSLNSNINTPTNMNSHRKTGSQSSIYGHSRRHSLGLNEAKKAAAEEQAKRTTGLPSSSSQQQTNENINPDALANKVGNVSLNDSHTSQQPTAFRFPPAPVNTNASSRSPIRKLDTTNVPIFKFPPTPNGTPLSGQDSNDDDFSRVTNSHRRSRSTNQNNNSNSNNWRSRPQSPSYNNNNNNLNQQNLSPFRGHKNSSSRDYNSFNFLEQPPVFQKSHKPRNSNSSVGSFSLSNNNNNNNSGNTPRKSLFAPYLPQANIPELIQEGRLVTGILRVNKKNRSDAWVSTDGVLDSDIYICGSKDRNRALEGDLVAVELLVVDDVWGSKKEKEEKKRRKDASTQHDLLSLNSHDDYHNDASASIINNANTTNSPHTPSSNSPFSSNNQNNNQSNSNNSNTTTTTLSTRSITPSSGGDNDDSNSPGIRRRGSLKQRPTQKKNDDVEVEGQSLLLVEEEEISDEFKPLYAGHVVAVLDRIPGQLFSGTLGLLRPSQQQQKNNDDNNNNNNNNNHHKMTHTPKIVWFKPTDKKVPLIAIPTELAPKDFVENAEKYSDTLFVASIKRWPITSLHPFGILVSELGLINDPNVEIDSILRDNNFLSNEYQDPNNPSQERSTLYALPLTDEQMASRRDLTNESTVAISSNGIVSEFAVHIKEIDNDIIEFGAHVIDATAHIEENSSLDRRARKRSSAVFMPQKIVNLLPKVLNDSLTLAPGKKSATLSVICLLNKETYEIKSTWIGETVINPTASLSISQIDEAITNSDQQKTSFINDMHNVAQHFYSQRLENKGAKISESLSLLESLDDEKVRVDLNIFDRYVGTAVVTELERKANCIVAEKIYSKLGNSAFLRRQAQPIRSKMISLQRKIQKFGYDLDITSADSLIRSILGIDDDDVRCGAELLFFKTMTRARYFIAGKVEPDQYGDYTLNLPLFTHFTSPLRRYADHVVHRQLKSILHDNSYNEDLDSLKITSEYCNFKKDCAHQAQEQAVHLLLCKTINDMGNRIGQLLTVATVLQVYESSFDVFIPEFGIEKRVHGDQLPLIKAEFDSANRVLELYWKPEVDSATFVPADEKNPKSYRNSIKNKFRSSTQEIINEEYLKIKNDVPGISDSLANELRNMDLKVPELRLPPQAPGKSGFATLCSLTETRVENDNHIEVIREMQKIPILLRAEIGMALPCLSVRTINPFMKEK